MTLVVQGANTVLEDHKMTSPEKRLMNSPSVRQEGSYLYHVITLLFYPHSSIFSTTIP